VPSPAGPAYVDDQGALRPGVGIWAWRNFLRRSATMQHTITRRTGKPTVLYIHMTNVSHFCCIQSRIVHDEGDVL
jgi:hypothetical protein